MPILKIWTNVARLSIPPTFVRDTVRFTAKVLEKPENVTICILKANQDIQFGTNQKPCAFVTLHSIDKFNAESNKGYAKLFGEHISQNLGAQMDRVTIKFDNMDANFVGFNGTTKADEFARLAQKK